MAIFFWVVLALSTAVPKVRAGEDASYLSWLDEQLEVLSEVQMERAFIIEKIGELFGLDSSNTDSDDKPKDCSTAEPESYTTVTLEKYSEGSPPFPCVTWYEPPSTMVEKDTDLTKEDIDFVVAPMLGGHGYAGDGKYSDNLNNLLSGRSLSEWNQPPEGKAKGWSVYGPGPWENQIVEFAKKLATALNKLPDAKLTVYRGGWSPKENMKEMKVGDIQKKSGFVSTTSDEAWAQGFAHDYHYPRSGARGDVKQPGWVSTMYTITACRAKDIRNLNPRESELIILPNSQFKVTKISEMENMKFAGFLPEKVAEWLDEFKLEGKPAMVKCAAKVKKEKIDGNMILEAYATGSFFDAQDLMCGKDNPEAGYPQPKYMDADGEEKSLYTMFRSGEGAGAFEGMFTQGFAPLASAGRATNVPSKVGKYYAVEMEEMCA